jgi:MYXO-CTERM domain-containing protein
MSNARRVIKFQAFSRRSALALGLTLGLFAESAAAANRVVWKQTKIKEDDKSWKVALEVHLDRAPDVPHVPVRFTFTGKTYFERALVDGRKEPVTRQIPLEHQQPIVESVDIGFLDPGTGQSARRTRFSFRVTRDRGFEAGQYEVEVTDARSGKDMGAKTTLTLEGENEVIDRRSMVFEDKPKPKADAPTQAAAKPAEPELTPDDEAFWAGGKPPTEKQSALPPPAHMQERPGCGCRVDGGASPASGFALTALAAALLMRRRSAALESGAARKS